MPPHILSHIDLEDKIAFCSVCLWTEIHVPNSRPGKAPKVVCMKRFGEMQKYHKRVGETRRKKPIGKPRHLLSDIDTVNKLANCSVCGSAPIRKQGLSYACANLARANGRKSQSANYRPRSVGKNTHILAQIDESTRTAICSICGVVEVYVYKAEERIVRRCSNAPVRGIPAAMKIRQEINIEVINRFKIRHGCKSCGTRANPDVLNINPDVLEICSRKPGKKAPNLKKLVALNRAELMLELSESDVICLDCYAFPKKEYESGIALTA
jgi:hypothetical protein